jgi:hypothetical protein
MTRRNKSPKRPAAEPATQTKRIFDAAGAVLIEILTNGRPLHGADGMPLVDASGQPVTKAPSAADLSVALKYSQIARANPTLDPNGRGNTIGELAKAAAKRQALSTAALDKAHDEIDDNDEA